ncbi:MAG: hypothetical protein Q8941_12320 [Bacteroidota bacterium]|nr:hypothetical protein [Bacteroidota bacterium]
MRKIFLLSGILFCLSVFVNAQGTAMSVYAELGGPGLASINFDTRFSKKEGGFGGRIGVGGFSLRDDFTGNRVGIVFLPIGVNYLMGRDNRNYFEIGGGVTPVFGTGEISNDFSGTFGHIIIGYRSQPANGGFTFRAFICPIFGNGVFIPYYAGLSFGYKFANGSK